MTDAARAVACLKTLFHSVGGGKTFLCSLPNQRGGRPGEVPLLTQTPVTVPPFIERWDVPGRGLFFCIGTIKEDAKPTRRGSYRSKANILTVPAIPIDIDFDKIDTRTDNPQAAVLSALNRCRLPPHVLIASGGGVHAHWRLDAPLNGPDGFQVAEDLMRKLARRFCADPAVADVAHLMRLPGSTNSKRGDERPVLLLKNQDTLGCSIKELLRLAAETPESWSLDEPTMPTSKPPETFYGGARGGGMADATPANSFEAYAADAWKEPVDVGARLKAMRYQGQGDAGVHVTQLVTTASLLNSGMSIDDTTRLVLGATAAVAPTNWDLQIEEELIRNMCVTWVEKHPPDNVVSFPTAPQPKANGEDHAATAEAKTTALLPKLAWSTGEGLKTRAFLYGGFYTRGFISCTIGVPGVGKSSLSIAECTAMATGRNLLGVATGDPLCVWYHNGEDPYEELQRRFAGVNKLHGLSAEEVDTLYVTSGRKLPLILAAQGKGMPRRNEQTIAWIKQALKQHRVDVWSFGPLAAMHELEENNNVQMNFLLRILSEIAEECDCAIDFEHHSRKLGGDLEVTTDTARGASAIIAATRSARTLNTMTSDEAEKLDVEGQVRQHFRLDNPRTSMRQAVEQAQWFKLVSVDIDNGDQVGVATAWEAELNVYENITQGMIEATLDGIRQSDQWRLDARSKQWIGYALAGGLGIDQKTASGKRRLLTIIDDWLHRGVLRSVKRLDATRRMRDFVEAP